MHTVLKQNIIKKLGMLIQKKNTGNDISSKLFNSSYYLLISPFSSLYYKYLYSSPFLFCFIDMILSRKEYYCSEFESSRGTTKINQRRMQNKTWMKDTTF